MVELREANDNLRSFIRFLDEHNKVKDLQYRHLVVSMRTTADKITAEISGMMELMEDLSGDAHD